MGKKAVLVSFALATLAIVLISISGLMMTMIMWKEYNVIGNFSEKYVNYACDRLDSALWSLI